LLNLKLLNLSLFLLATFDKQDNLGMLVSQISNTLENGSYASDDRAHAQQRNSQYEVAQG